MLQVGETLAGYRIEGIAGMGGMGVVYRATQLSLERPVALKVLSPGFTGNDAFRERFRREGRHAAALDHPNIIPVYEAGEADDQMFIAMRLVDGPTLAELMAQGPMAGRDCVRVLGAIAAALDAAHAGGLVHRDIKPPNILITRAGHPYLADFGITKGADISGLTKTGDIVGTLSYVAPETMSGETATAASDIYSLAAVLFQCLTGRRPYERDTEAALIHAHLSAPPPTLSGLGLDVPAALDAVFARGMAKAPGDRPAGAGELLAALEAALPADAWQDGTVLQPPREPTPVPAPPSPTPTPAPPRTEPTPAGEVTTADRRRAPAARAPQARRRTHPAVIAAVVAGVIAAPVIGYALGDDGHAPPADREAGSSAVRLGFPAAWSPAPRERFPSLETTAPVSLRHTSGAVLVAGRLKDPAAGLDPVRSALEAAFTEPQRSTVRIGDRTGVLRTGTLASGGSGWLLTLPDTAGWTVVACRTAITDTALGTLCGPRVQALRTPGATPVALAPDPALARRLSAAVRAVNEARRAAAAGLAARAPRDRADAASTLAEVHDQAAGDLRTNAARVQDRPLVENLEEALRRQSRAFAGMARAARRRQVKAYADQRLRARGAERRTREVLRSLRRGGYR